MMNPVTDQEIADGIRLRFTMLARPIVDLIAEAETHGFIMNFSINLKDGKPDLRCDISKVVKL